MSTLAVKNLCKNYPAFSLKDISFELAPGKITGFIGRNGAGKTTTLKSLTHFVHPDGGEITFFGKNFEQNEQEIKQRIGFVSGGIDYYPRKKIKTITDVTRHFYAGWDDKTYRRYLEMFGLSEDKTPSTLSDGMKVKYALTLALSHNAELLILDEPTSGLDPVSRDDLLDVFLTLVDEGITILFSTHITSDLDKCADRILYIKNGRLLADADLREYVASYKLVRFGSKQDTPVLIGQKRTKDGFAALVKTKDAPAASGEISDANLEDIMIHMEKEEEE